jgi:cytochrome oxidase assembly protein ShyY1
VSPDGPWALRRWPGHLLVAVLFGGAVLLGSWQYGAGQAERDASARDLTDRDPVALSDVLGPDDPFPAPSVGQPVTVSGTWVDEATVFVTRGDSWWVVTPLVVDDPAADGAALPVVRGVGEEPTAPPVEGEAEVTGWLQPGEGTGAADDDPTDDVLPQLRPADLVQRLDEDLYSGYLVSQQPTDGLTGASLEQLPQPDRFTGLRNFLYALEWWVFGAFAVFVWVRHLMDEARPVDRVEE